MAGDWNILAARISGDGYFDIVETELPMTISDISRNVSAPSTMDGTISHGLKQYKNQGRPVFEPWNTVLIAVSDDQIRGLTLYRRPTFDGSAWKLDQIGLPGYLIGLPYDGEERFSNADPLDIYRHIWAHAQGHANGNLGITIDGLTSPVRVGGDGTVVVDDTQAEKPRELNWWSTTDLGKTVDDLSRETPFDWLEQVGWDGDQPHCHIALGHPTIGGRKDQLRFVLGENLADVPGVGEADYVNGLWTLGAGEGRDRVRGYAGVTDGRLRRAQTYEDKSLTGTAQANAVAAERLGLSRGQFTVDSVEVYDHPNAPLAEIEPGDEVPLYAETDWVTVDQYVRVIGISESPQKSDRAVLTVMRSVQA